MSAAQRLFICMPSRFASASAHLCAESSFACWPACVCWWCVCSYTGGSKARPVMLGSLIEDYFAAHKPLQVCVTLPFHPPRMTEHVPSKESMRLRLWALVHIAYAHWAMACRHRSRPGLEVRTAEPEPVVSQVETVVGDEALYGALQVRR